MDYNPLSHSPALCKL